MRVSKWPEMYMYDECMYDAVLGGCVATNYLRAL